MKKFNIPVLLFLGTLLIFPLTTSASCIHKEGKLRSIEDCHKELQKVGEILLNDHEAFNYAFQKILNDPDFLEDTGEQVLKRYKNANGAVYFVKRIIGKRYDPLPLKKVTMLWAMPIVVKPKWKKAIEEENGREIFMEVRKFFGYKYTFY